MKLQLQHNISVSSSKIHPPLSEQGGWTEKHLAIIYVNVMLIIDLLPYFKKCNGDKYNCIRMAETTLLLLYTKINSFSIPPFFFLLVIHENISIGLCKHTEKILLATHNMLSHLSLLSCCKVTSMHIVHRE